MEFHEIKNRTKLLKKNFDKESKLELLSSVWCKAFLPEKLRDTHNKELCTGKIVTYTVEPYFYYENRTTPKASHKCPYCPKFKKPEVGGRTPKLRKKLKKISHLSPAMVRSTSCAGDSGSPLWMWKGKKKPRAVLVGVVNRGKMCGTSSGKNRPTYYTRVKMILSWIRKTTG